MDTIATAVRRLHDRSRECIDNAAPYTVPDDLQTGDSICQGDVTLMRLARLPHGAKRIEWPESGQIAPGNITGSRHCVPERFHGHVELYRIDDRDVLSDLCLVAQAPFDLCHPEHADHIGYPAGVYRVLHQQNEQRQRIVE